MQMQAQERRAEFPLLGLSNGGGDDYDSLDRSPVV